MSRALTFNMTGSTRSRLRLGAGLLALGIIAASGPVRPADADCLAQAWTAHEVDAVYLGTYRDLAGEAASFFYDAAHKQVLGPLVHAVRPGRKLSFRPGAVPRATPAQQGKLSLRVLSSGSTLDPATAAAPGFFVSFAPGRDKADLVKLLPAITEPFTLGLLLGSSPVQAEVEKQIDSILKQPNQGIRLAIGLLYSADAARARSLMAGHPLLSPQFRVANKDAALLITLVHEGPKGLASLPDMLATPAPGSPRSNVEDWTAALPALAKRWLAGKKNLSAALDELAFGRDLWAEYPLDAQRQLGTGECHDPHEDLVFDTPDRFGNAGVIAALKRRDPAFARVVAAAFKGFSSGQAIVVDRIMTKPEGLLVVLNERHDGEFSLLRVPPAFARTEPGRVLSYVARIDATKQGEPTAKEAGALRALELGRPRITQRVTLEKPTTSLVDALTKGIRSGHGPTRVGMRIATLFALARKNEGIDLAEFRKRVWSLPGNKYDDFGAWTREWRPTLESALIHGRDPELANELDRVLPDLLARFAAPPTAGKPKPVASNDLRGFLIFTGIRQACLYLMNGEPEKAHRVIERANGPLAPLLPAGVVLAPETDQNYYSSRIRPFRVLTAALTGQDAKALVPEPRHFSFDMQLFQGLVKMYPPDVVATWNKTLAKLGYPAR